MCQLWCSGWLKRERSKKTGLLWVVKAAPHGYPLKLHGNIPPRWPHEMRDIDVVNVVVKVEKLSIAEPEGTKQRGLGRLISGAAAVIRGVSFFLIASDTHCVQGRWRVASSRRLYVASLALAVPRM